MFVLELDASENESEADGLAARGDVEIVEDDGSHGDRADRSISSFSSAGFFCRTVDA